MVKHWSDKPGRPPLCGHGYFSDNPPTQDKSEVTCKSCIRWLTYYANKKK